MSHETVEMWKKGQDKKPVVSKKEKKRKKIMKLVEEILKEVL